jgi:hypothetical protein
MSLLNNREALLFLTGNLPSSRLFPRSSIGHFKTEPIAFCAAFSKLRIAFETGEQG